MKKLMILALCAAVVPAAYAADNCQPWAQAQAEWTCVKGGDVSAQQQPVVLRSAQEWAKFWSRHTGSETAPAVDFAKAQILAYEGSEASSFKAVRVTDLAAEGAREIVTPRQALKSAESRVAQALSGVRAAEAKTDDVVASANAELASLTGFDGRASLRDAVASPALSDPKVFKVACTPGVDCPAAPRSAPSQSRQSCTPGVDCPAPSRPQPRSSCTPGVDCPGSSQPPKNCTPGVDCPSNGGTPSIPTPAPDNYRPRPSSPPSTFPDWSGVDRFNNGPDTASFWMSRRDAFGDPIEDEGSWNHEVARGEIHRAGSEKGTQGTQFRVTLASQESRRVYRLYWRYVGYNCNPNDSSRCMTWSTQQAWFYERTETGRAKAMSIEAEIENDQPLLPWETETIVLTYDGSNVGVDDSYAGFQYAVRGPIIDQQAGVATVELTPRARRKRAPEFDKVIVRLQNQGGRLMMVVDDQRASFYQGERMEMGYQVMRKCDGWWECTKNFGDIKVAEVSEDSPISFTVQAGQPFTQAVQTSGSGQYYLNWFFRRAGSQYSNDSWSGWKATDKVSF